MLYNVPDGDVRVALAAYGKVVNVTRERWRVHGVVDKGSTTRWVTVQLKPGVQIDVLPHQLRVAGDNALLVAARTGTHVLALPQLGTRKA